MGKVYKCKGVGVQIKRSYKMSVFYKVLNENLICMSINFLFYSRI